MNMSGAGDLMCHFFRSLKAGNKAMLHLSLILTKLTNIQCHAASDHNHSNIAIWYVDLFIYQQYTHNCCTSHAL